MTYLLQKYSDDYYVIVNDDADYNAGTVERLKPDLGRPKFCVRNDNGKEIAVVNSVDEAIPALATYYEKNPPQWESDSDRIADLGYATAPGCSIKETHFALLRVDEIKPGQWSAYRNHYELFFDEKIAVFATREEAQRVADTHERDGYPNSKAIDDGFSWLPDPNIDWRTCPYRVAARARLAA